MSVGGYFSSWFLAGMSIALCMAVVGAVPGSNLFDAATGNMVESSTACGAKGCIRCDECTDSLFKEASVLQALLLESSNDSGLFDSLAAARSQLDRLLVEAQNQQDRKSVLDNFVMTGYQMLGYTVTLSPEAIVGDGLDLSGSGSGSGGGSGSVVKPPSAEDDLDRFDMKLKDSIRPQLPELSDGLRRLATRIAVLQGLNITLGQRADEADDRSEELLQALQDILDDFADTRAAHMQALTTARKLLMDVRANTRFINDRTQFVMDAQGRIVDLTNLTTQEQQKNGEARSMINTGRLAVEDLARLIRDLYNASVATRNITMTANSRLDSATEIHNQTAKFLDDSTTRLAGTVIEIHQTLADIQMMRDLLDNATETVTEKLPSVVEAIKNATKQLQELVQKYEEDSQLIGADLRAIREALSLFTANLTVSSSIFDTVMDLGNRTAAAASVYGDISAVIQAALGNASQSVQIAEESLALARNQTLQGLPEKASQSKDRSDSLKTIVDQLKDRLDDARTEFMNLGDHFRVLMDLRDGVQANRSSADDRLTELDRFDESQRIDQGKRDLSSLERNASSNNESISASERRLEDAGIQQRRMDRNLNNIRSNNTEAAAIVAALDTTGTVNTTAAANKIMDDIRVRTKTLFGLLSDVQEKIAWAQGRLANFPGAVRLSTTGPEETGPSLELSLGAGLSDSYSPYTSVRLSVNPASPSGGTQNANGLLFYLGPTLKESTEVLSLVDSITVVIRNGVLGATVRGGYHDESDTVEFSFTDQSGQPYLIQTGQWYQINVTRFGNWDIRADVRVPSGGASSRTYSDTQPLFKVKSDKFNLKPARFFLGGIAPDSEGLLPEGTGTFAASAAGCYNGVSINKQAMGVWNSSASTFSAGGSSSASDHTCQECGSSGADLCRRSRLGNVAPGYITTDGGSYVRYPGSLFSAPQGATRTPERNQIRLKFKTPSQDGIILSICDNSTQDSLTAFLRDSAFYVQITNSSGVAITTSRPYVEEISGNQVGFSNNEEFSIDYSGPDVDFETREEYYFFSVSLGTDVPRIIYLPGRFRFPSQLYHGGLPLSAPQYCRPSVERVGGFKGCLTSPDINDQPRPLTLDKPLRPDVDPNGVSLNRCAKNLDGFRTCAQLAGDFSRTGGKTAAFILFRRRDEGPDFLHYFTSRARISFNFQTSREAAVLLFASRDGQQISGGSVSEFFQVSLSTGQLYLEMHGIADVGFGSFVRFTRGRYNDGKVHQFVMKHDIVTVGDQEIGRVVIEIDHVVEITANLIGLQRNWLSAANTFLSFGGIPRSVGARVRGLFLDSLVGCICDVVVNDRIFNFADAFQRNSLVSYTSCQLSELPRRVPAPPPTEPTVPPTTKPPNCPAMTHSYVSDCLRFAAHSRLRYSLAGKPEVQPGFSLTLSFRTRLLNTVVVYGSAVSDDRRFFSVTIESGVIVFRIDTRMAVEDSVTRVAMPAGDSFSDGMWHTLKVERRGRSFRVDTDEGTPTASLQRGSTANALLGIDGHIHFGAQPDDSLLSRLSGLGLQRFVGVMRDIVFLDNDDNSILTEAGETQANLSSGCYEFVRGLDRSAHGYPLVPGVPAYTQLLQIQGVSLSPNINVQLELSTRHGMGMLFYWSAEDGSILTVQLNNGLVEFKIVSGGTELVSIVHPTPVCLGEFYNIDIFLSAIEQRLTVGIVNEENTAELRQEQIASPLTMRDTAYVGYADPSASDIGSVVSFNGCIRSIQVGTESFSPLTSSNSRAENVNTNTCHVLPRP